MAPLAPPPGSATDNTTLPYIAAAIVACHLAEIASKQWLRGVSWTLSLPARTTCDVPSNNSILCTSAYFLC